MTKCGGSLDKNIGAAALFTFIPWILIFGAMLAVLIIFPGFKSAFSDVIGYYVVAGGANDIFGQILLGADLNEMIEQTTDINKKNELTKLINEPFVLLETESNKSQPLFHISRYKTCPSTMRYL